MKGDTITVQAEGDRGPFTFTVTEDNEADCRLCGAPVVWCITKKGKKMPVDLPDRVDEPTTSHFSTCPNGTQWRKA